MSPDAFVLALLAIADLAFIVHLRKRHAQRVRMERVTLALQFAVRRANEAEELTRPRPLLALPCPSEPSPDAELVEA